jgi:DNA-binding transcriptional ArsR family regulator
MNRKDRHDVARIFRALAVEKRVEIVRLIAKRSLCVGALSNLSGISAGAVSQHLRVLRDAGLVEAERRGYFTHYSLAPDARERCRSVVNALFGAKEGGRRCAAGRQSAKSRKP